MILNMEKVMTLAAALHHRYRQDAPNGIRNRADAEEFLSSHSAFDVDDFTNFGRYNRDGYGDYYYRGPLQALGIWEVVDGEIRFSPLGEEVASLFLRAARGSQELFLKKRLSDRILEKLSGCCFCAESIPMKEKRVWQKIFFAFTRPSKRGRLEIDQEAFTKFKQEGLEHSEFNVGDEPSTESNFQLNAETALLAADEDLQVSMNRALGRRYTLLMFLNIISEAMPPISDLDQTIRDGIYYKQVFTGKRVKSIDFGKTDGIRALWEVYVHNLYYISFLEFAFYLFLEALKKKPFGIPDEEVASKFNVYTICEAIKSLGVSKAEPDGKIEEIDTNMRNIIGDAKTSLQTPLNERKIFLNLLGEASAEEEVANLILLALLLRHRFGSFTSKQLAVSRKGEHLLGPAAPQRVYSSLLDETIPFF